MAFFITILVYYRFVNCDKVLSEFSCFYWGRGLDLLISWGGIVVLPGPDPIPSIQIVHSPTFCIIYLYYPMPTLSSSPNCTTLVINPLYKIRWDCLWKVGPQEIRPLPVLVLSHFNVNANGACVLLVGNHLTEIPWWLRLPPPSKRMLCTVGENATSNFVMMGISAIRQAVVYCVPPTQETVRRGRDAAVRIQKALQNTPPLAARFVHTHQTIWNRNFAVDQLCTQRQSG